jgi:hypothetical protein
MKDSVARKTHSVSSTKRIRNIGKQWLKLSQRAGVESLYLSYQTGRMNLLLIGLLADVGQIAHGLRLL